MSIVWYNDGTQEYQVTDETTVSPTWTKGRLKRVCYNDGKKTIRILSSETPPSGFVRGRLAPKIPEEVEQQRRNKIKQYLQNRSEEQIQQTITKMKNTKQEHYGNSNFNNVSKRKQTCLETYGDTNYSNRELFVKTLNQKSEEERNASNRKRSDALKKFHQELSPEMQAEFHKVRLGHTVSKETRLKLSENWTEEKIQTMLTKYSDTCQQKYGVPFFCMSDKCRQNSTSASKPNKNFAKLLESFQCSYETEFFIEHYSYDFKVNNNLIEINPFATHNSTWSPYGDLNIKQSTYHRNKSLVAKENGYRCIHIWDWDDADKIIHQLLLPKETVYGRNCAVQLVDTDTAKQFIDKNHLQGYAKSEINIGLYYQNELISIMTFGKPRYNKNYQYELIRYCSSKKVLGGAEKLFSYFTKTYFPSSIISYCDLSKFDGHTYEKLGFECKSKLPMPSKHWYNAKTEKHITDNLLRQRGFDQLFGTDYGKGTSNEELMIEHGFVEIYDAGQATYIWINND